MQKWSDADCQPDSYPNNINLFRDIFAIYLGYVPRKSINGKLDLGFFLKLAKQPTPMKTSLRLTSIKADVTKPKRSGTETNYADNLTILKSTLRTQISWQK